MFLKPVILFSYSGHSFVVCECLQSQGRYIKGYLEKQPKYINPYDLTWLGHESDSDVQSMLICHDYVIAIGDNHIRAAVQNAMETLLGYNPISIFHKDASIASTSLIGDGTLVAARAVINPLAEIGKGAIINTGAIVEHECKVGDFSHIAPGAVLTGKVEVGNRTFVGANAVVKQQVCIGDDVVIGAGAVIINDVPDGATVVGNPGRIIKNKFSK